MTNRSGEHRGWVVVSNENRVFCGTCGVQFPIKDPRTLFVWFFPIVCYECKSELGAVIVNPNAHVSDDYESVDCEYCGKPFDRIVGRKKATCSPHCTLKSRPKPKSPNRKFGR